MLNLFIKIKHSKKRIISNTVKLMIGHTVKFVGCGSSMTLFNSFCKKREKKHNLWVYIAVNLFLFILFWLLCSMFNMFRFHTQTDSESKWDGYKMPNKSRTWSDGIKTTVDFVLLFPFFVIREHKVLYLPMCQCGPNELHLMTCWTEIIITTTTIGHIAKNLQVVYQLECLGAWCACAVFIISFEK